MSFTNAQLATKIADLIEYWSSFNEEYSDWIGGDVGGGINLDGEYPLTNWAGIETLLPCPAQLSDNVTGYVAIVAASAAAAATSETNAGTSESNAAASEAVAIAQAVLADADRVAAELAETNAQDSSVTATAQANLATLRAGYSSEWAITPEDTLVSVAAGGDGATDYSSLHWAAKATAIASGSVPSVSQAEAEAGTEVADRLWSPLRTKQAIDALGGGGLPSYGDNVALLLGDAGDISMLWDGADFIINSPNQYNADWHWLKGADLYIWNTTNLDYMRLHHDGADANIECQGTNELNLFGCPNGMKVWNSTKAQYFGMSQSVSSAQFGTSSSTIIMNCAGASPSVQLTGGTQLRIRDDGGLRIYDAGDTDYVDMNHDGTDFNLMATNTTQYTFGFAGAEKWRIRADYFENVSSYGPRFMTANASQTVPTLVPHKIDSTTGIGGDGVASAAILSLISASVERLQVNPTGAIITGTLDVSGHVELNGGTARMTGTTAAFYMNESDQGVDGKEWVMGAVEGAFVIGTQTDLGVFDQSAFSIERSGLDVTTVTILGDSLNLASPLMNVLTGGGVQFLDSTNTDAAKFLHDGTDLTLTDIAGTGKLKLVSLDLEVSGASTLTGAVTAGALALLDNNTLTLGTGSDSVLDFDGTNTVWATAGVFKFDSPIEVANLGVPYHVTAGYVGGKITVASTAPSTPAQGDLWFDNT